MSDYASVNGLRVASCRVSTPHYGLWAADVVLPSGTLAVDARAALTIGGWSLSGFVARSAEYGGDVTARIIGGAGGWRRDVPAQCYTADVVRLATVLGDVAALVGETLEGVSASASVGRGYVRTAGPASRVLRELAGSTWHMGHDGVTRLSARPTTPIVSEFHAISRDGATGRVRVATEHPEDWTPGRTFASATTPDVLTILFASVSCEPSGALRVEVLT